MLHHSPLNTILNYSQMIRDDEDLPKETTLEFAHQIHQTALEFQEMSKRILLVSDLEERNEQNRLATPLEEVLDMIRDSFGSSVTTEPLREETSIIMDQQLLFSAVKWMVEDARLRTPESEVVTLNASSKNSAVSLVVTCPIALSDDEISSSVNGPDHRDMSRFSGLQGLRLFATKKIAESLGGSLSLDNSNKEETHYMLSLPLE